jgi:hypothetical protein
MEDEADRVGCNRKTLEGHRTALVTLGWLTFVTGPVPNYRGTEYRLTIPERAQKTDTLEASAVTVLPTERDRSTESVPVLRTEHAQKPHINMTENMTSTNMSLKHEPTAEPTGEEHPGCTHLGKHAWCGVEANAKAAADAKAKAALAEEMDRAPDFD